MLSNLSKDRRKKARLNKVYILQIPILSSFLHLLYSNILSRSRLPGLITGIPFLHKGHTSGK